MDSRIGQRNLVGKLRGLAIPVMLAFFALSSFWVGVALGQTTQTLILDNRDNAWGSITQDGIYRNGGFEYDPASPQWSSAHFLYTSYVQISTHAFCPDNRCQHVRDGNHTSEYWRRGIYRGTTIPAGGQAFIVQANVYPVAHSEHTGDEYGIGLGYTIGGTGVRGYVSFDGLPTGEVTAINECADLDIADLGTYPDLVYIGKMASTSTAYSANAQYYVDDVVIHTIPVSCEDYVPPTPPPSGGGGYTTTVPITGTCVATVNGSEVNLAGNLLANPSFEETANGVIPDSWTFRSPLYAPELYIENDGGGAADGVAYLSQPVMPGNSVNQDVFLPASPEFLIGVLVSNTKAFDGGWGVGVGDQVIEGDGVTSGYQSDEGIVDFGGEVYSDTVFSLILLDSLDTGRLNLDMAYMIPISDTGSGYEIYCPAVQEHCEATNCTGTPTTTPTTSGYPTGTGASAQCRTCPTPSSWLAIGEWLAYGWCIVTSLFVCHLRVWIWEATNIILAFPAWIISAVNTINTVLNFVSGNGGWLATILGLAIGAPFTIYNTAVNFLVAMYANLQLGLGLGSNTLTALFGLDRYFSFFFSVVEVVLSVSLTARTILYAMFDYVQLALATLPVIQDAIASEPMPLDEFLGTYYEGEEAYTNTAVAVGTPSEATILMVIFWGMWLMDSILVDYHLWPLTWLAIAGIGFYTLYWLFNEWSSLFSSAQLD